MLDGVMAQNAVGLAFGGGMQEMKKAGQVCICSASIRLFFVF